MRLSSAKFEPNRIEVTERIGLDLILPLAAMLPFERHIRWAERKQLPAKVAEELLDGAGALAAALIGTAKFAGLKGRLVAVGRSRRRERCDERCGQARRRPTQEDERRSPRQAGLLGSCADPLRAGLG